MLKQLTMMKKVVLLFLLVSVFSFSKDFWEKSNFTVNVVEDATINGKKRSKSYIMNYNSGTLKLTRQKLIKVRSILLVELKKQFIIQV